MNTKDIIKSAKERLHIEALTPMQHKLAGLSASERAVALIAPTGSGKTLAFALAMFPRVNGGTGNVEGLVIAPTRELSLQITKTLSVLAPALRITALYGGHSVQDEARSLDAAAPDIVVGTPGRILDHINRGRLDLYRVKVLVCDEYDKSLELGFQDEMRRIVKKIHSTNLIILTSATRLDVLPQWLGIEKLTTLDFGSLPPPKLDEYIVESPEADKLNTLAALLNTVPPERTLVFVNHRESAERVYQFLCKKKFPAILYHGALDQQDRETAVDLFTNGTTPIMVATDLAARGLDIPQVRSVVHYHQPLTPETRTHRNGRAARMGAEGEVYHILAPGEDVNDVRRTMRVDERPTAARFNTPRTLYFHAGKKEKLSKGDIVGALTGTGGLSARQIGMIALHDHRALVAVTDVDADALAASLNASRIKARRIRVTPVKL